MSEITKEQMLKCHSTGTCPRCDLDRFQNDDCKIWESIRRLIESSGEVTKGKKQEKPRVKLSRLDEVIETAISDPLRARRFLLDTMNIIGVEVEEG